jgi:flagellar hook-associated protein 3 FlgL
MRITQRTIYQNINQNISTITEQLKNINEQIASGKRINKPSDDPPGITHALNLKEVLSQVTQYGKNIQHGQSWLQMTESSLQRVEELIIRAKEIANQMSTGTYSASQRADAAKEIQNILEQLVQIGNTKINGRYIFSGNKDHTPAYELGLSTHPAVAGSGNNPAYTGTATSSGTFTGLYSKGYVVEITSGGAVGTAQYRVSEDGGLTWGSNLFTTSTTPTDVYSDNSIEVPPAQGVQIAFTDSGTLTAGDRFTIEVSRYNGDQEDMSILIGPSAQMKINLPGDTAFGQAGDTENNLFDILAGLKTSLENNNIQGVQAGLERLGTVQVTNTSNMADVGSRLNRIEVNQNMLSDLDANNTKRLSGIEDIDITKAVADLNAKQIVFQAALYSAVKVAQLSVLDYMS